MKYANKDNPPNNFRLVRQQIIWGNQHIALKGKCLILKNWINSSILYVNDILDNEGKISENTILSKLDEKQNWISESNQLKTAVPKE